jgi:hypothetical protein
VTTYRTIEAVEICTAGMDWPASTGPSSITLEHIADAVIAANDDPHIRVPRGKLGHTSQVNGALQSADWDPFAQIGDAAPAFGRFVNFRTANDGAVLLADAVDVPDWINASTFPSRSMEAVFGVTTEGGRQYSMVVTDVAWLGAKLPAVSDVEDLVALVREGPAALSKEKMPMAVNASVSATTVRERFNEAAWQGDYVAEGHDTTWWWARDVRVDPDELIVDDDEGHLFSVPFQTDGEDAVTFGDPTPVRETYIPVAASAAPSEATAPDTQRVAATFSRPHRTQQSKEVSLVDPKELREKLSLAEDASDEDVAAKLDELAALPSADDVEAQVAERVEEAVAAARKDEREKVAASGVKTIDEAELQQLKEDAAAGRAAREQQVAAARDQTIDEAIRDGKFPPSRREHYAKLMAADEQGTRELIASLEAGTIPVRERGEARMEATGNDDAAHAAYMARHFGLSTTKAEA